MEKTIIFDFDGVILDSFKEVEGLGIHSIAVSWGYHSSDRLRQSDAEVVIHSPEELQKYFS